MSDWLVAVLATLGFLLVLSVMDCLNKHRHKWLLDAAQPYRAPTSALSGPQTVLLYRCTRCPDLRTQLITGEWDKRLTPVVTGEVVAR